MDPCLNILWHEDELAMILSLYVDDLAVACGDANSLREFEVCRPDIGFVSSFLGRHSYAGTDC
jgi:hypothetical protein